MTFPHDEQSSTGSASLNEYQQRALKISCAHVDGMLGDMEGVLDAAQSKSVFPKYVNDITPVQRKTIEDYVARVRAQLLRILAGQSITPDKPHITASHSVHTALTFAEIAVEELGPEKMRGYGEVSPEGAADLQGLMQELQAVLGQLHSYLLQRGAPDLRDRLMKVEQQGKEINLLGMIEEIVTRHGLVEFRTTLAMLLDRIEDTAFEIALFGRVGSGKSSLLNHLIGADILPVGVTPITAVPTRVSYGEDKKVRVWIEGLGLQEAPLENLPDYVDERLNPGNKKRVARIHVYYPSERLREGTILVDTPGLGSLATTGAEETMAYLPRCDAAVVLIDAGSTLTPDDLRIVQALTNASIPVSILLSKADLLDETDLQRIRDYVRDHVKLELGIDVTVRPVSVLPTHQPLLDAWFAEDLSELYSQRQRLRGESVTRKIFALRNAVRAALETERDRGGKSGPEPQLAVVEKELRRTASVLESISFEIRRITLEIPALAPSIVRKAAAELAEAWNENAAVDGGELLWHTATKAMVEVAGVIRDKLQTAGGSLRAELLEASAALQSGDVTAEDEFDPKREMPIFHMNREVHNVKRPPIASAFGHAALTRSAQKKLSGLKDSLQPALESYAALLGGWAGAALNLMAQQFNSYADRYRAQLDRRLSGRSGTKPDEYQLTRDIETLDEV